MKTRGSVRGTANWRAKDGACRHSGAGGPQDAQGATRRFIDAAQRALPLSPAGGRRLPLQPVPLFAVWQYTGNLQMRLYSLNIKT